MLNALKTLLQPKAAPAPDAPIDKTNCGVVKCYDENQQLKLVYYQCSYAVLGDAAHIVHGYKLVPQISELANRIAEAIIREHIAGMNLSSATDLPKDADKAIVNKLNTELAKFNISVAEYEISL